MVLVSEVCQLNVSLELRKQLPTKQKKSKIYKALQCEEIANSQS